MIVTDRNTGVNMWSNWNGNDRQMLGEWLFYGFYISICRSIECTENRVFTAFPYKTKSFHYTALGSPKSVWDQWFQFFGANLKRSVMYFVIILPRFLNTFAPLPLIYLFLYRREGYSGGIFSPEGRLILFSHK